MIALLACAWAELHSPWAVAQETNAPLPTLTQMRQVLALPRQEADRQYPVKVQGVVTYSDLSWGLLFVQDSTAGVFADELSPPLPFQPGDLLSIEGVTASGLFSPIINSRAMRLLQRTNLPAPRVIDIAELNAGGSDSQWVEVTGIVQVEELVADRLRLEIASGLNRSQAWVLRAEGYRNLKLTDSRVKLRGVGGAQFNARELKGFQVYVSSLADITVLETPLVDAFAKPVSLGRDLVTYISLGESEHRAHVQGVVTMQQPGGLLFIRDPSGGIYLQTSQAPSFRLGERVDAVGFKSPGLLTPRLQFAVVRSLGVSQSLKPVPISAAQSMSGKFNYELVQMEARLLQAQAPTREQLFLLLEAGEHTGTACLHGTNMAALASSLHPQSLLRLTGVCQITDTAGRPRPELTLWLRSPADIQVLTAPRTRPGGILSRVLWSLGLMLVAAAIPFSWMRRRARRQVDQALAESQRHVRGHIEERERISQDLHDNIMQSIYAVGLGLEDCRRLVQKAPAQAEERLAIAIRALNSVIQDVRQFIGGLEPRVLSGSELKTALKSLALTTGDSSSQVVIQVDPNATHHLTSQQATQLLNIAKEAMSNSLRHASATQTVVALRLEQGHVRLEVADDGCGFDPNHHHEGNGLHNVAARARELGARQEIISAPNKGTRMIVDLPPLSIHESRSTAQPFP